jgi:hypothetical protein
MVTWRAGAVQFRPTRWALTTAYTARCTLYGNKKVEPACKPGSVEDSHSSRAYVAVRLKRPTREQRGPRLMLPYLVLLRVGFTLPPVLPQARCALTAPFHPYRQPKSLRRYIFCGTGRGLTPPRHYLALCPMEPGLSSMPRRTQRLSSRLGGEFTMMTAMEGPTSNVSIALPLSKSVPAQSTS